MSKVTYFDVEWANGKNRSICQIGIMCENFEDGEPVYPEKNIYINPKDNFEEACVSVHGITAEKVCDKPTFPAVWKEIEPCFTNSIIIGHNVAASDLNALTKNLQRYNIDVPTFYYVDTFIIAKEFIPTYAVKNYSLSTLCDYFDIGIDNEHDAFDDACACKDLFLAMHKAFHFTLKKYIKPYLMEQDYRFVEFVSNPQLRKSISEFYGIIQGLNIDKTLTDTEISYIRNWEEQHSQYSEYYEIAEIIKLINEIARDGIIDTDEMKKLHDLMTGYYNTISSSPTTVATQILSGILKGIASDGIITTRECFELKKWLYENNYLSGHYPYDKIMELLNRVLANQSVSVEESKYLLSEIDAILNPVATIKTQISSVKGLTVCLSGRFAYGEKSDVGKYISDRGGIIVRSVSSKLNILLVGDSDCDAYAHGTYGTKIQKALELIAKGYNIYIVTESEFFALIK